LKDRRFRLAATHFDTGLTAQQVRAFRQLLTHPDFERSAKDAAAFASSAWGINADLVMSLDTAGLASLFDITGGINSGAPSSFGAKRTTSARVAKVFGKIGSIAPPPSAPTDPNALAPGRVLRCRSRKHWSPAR